jgi:hypothetical protein
MTSKPGCCDTMRVPITRRAAPCPYNCGWRGRHDQARTGRPRVVLTPWERLVYQPCHCPGCGKEIEPGHGVREWLRGPGVAWWRRPDHEVMAEGLLRSISAGRVDGSARAARDLLRQLRSVGLWHDDDEK